MFKSISNHRVIENMSFKKDVIESAGERFVLLSTNSWGSNFVHIGKTHHEYAFDWLWPFPWLYSHPTDPRAEKIRFIMADHLVKALEHQPAPTLLIDRSPKMRGLPRSSDNRPVVFFEEFLARDNEVLKNILRKYKFVKTIDGCKKDEVTPFSCRIDVFKSGDRL